MLSKERVLEILKNEKVLREGHFLLTSGRHSDRYLQCARLFRKPWIAEELCEELAEKFKDDNINIVIGPAMGAVQMAYEVSRAIKCENFFTERNSEGKMELRRGFTLNPNDRVLVVEDVVTTGGSVKEVIELVRKNGATVVGVGSIVDRTAGEISFGVPYKAVYSADVKSYTSDECPLCKASEIPLEKPGSRKNFR